MGWSTSRGAGWVCLLPGGFISFQLFLFLSGFRVPLLDERPCLCSRHLWTDPQPVGSLYARIRDSLNGFQSASGSLPMWGLWVMALMFLSFGKLLFLKLFFLFSFVETMSRNDGFVSWRLDSTRIMFFIDLIRKVLMLKF